MLLKPVKVGIIGCGSVSGSYISRLKKFEILELYACADLELYRAEAKAEQYKIPRYCTVEELLKDKKVQVILNLTPAKLHARINLANLYNDEGIAAYNKGDLQSALKYYRQAVDMDPSNDAANHKIFQSNFSGVQEKVKDAQHHNG